MKKVISYVFSREDIRGLLATALGVEVSDIKKMEYEKFVERLQLGSFPNQSFRFVVECGEDVEDTEE
jgi:coenzyme F420-reducing hydrogenase beta subunit